MKLYIFFSIKFFLPKQIMNYNSTIKVFINLEIMTLKSFV